MPKISYDKKAKTLGIRLSSKRSVDSDVKGNVVVDYDRQGNIVNIEVMKFSLAEFSRMTPVLKDLKNERGD